MAALQQSTRTRFEDIANLRTQPAADMMIIDDCDMLQWTSGLSPQREALDDRIDWYGV